MVSTIDRSRGKDITCPICGKPIDLDRDETANEDGHVMHAECYFRRVGGHERTPPDDHHTE
jgi:hypothetical protein